MTAQVDPVVVKKLFLSLYTVLSMFSSLVRLFLINPWLIPQRIQLKTSVACKRDEKGKGCLLLQRTGFLHDRGHRALARVGNGKGGNCCPPLFKIPKELNIMYFVKNHDIILISLYSIL